MNPEIEKVIEQTNAQLKEAQASAEQCDKQKLLDRFGLYTKEYCKRDSVFGFSKEQRAAYPCTEMGDDGFQKRYRKVYADVTDEDLEALKNAEGFNPQSGEDEETAAVGRQHGLAAFMQLLAVVIYFVFFILGIVMGNHTLESYLTSHPGFNWGTAVLYWTGGLIAGTMMLGFAHIVDHLYQQTLLLRQLCKKNKA